MSNPSCCFLQVYLSQDNPMGQYPIFTSWLWYLEHFVSFGQTFPLLTPNTHTGPIFGSTSPIVLRYSIIVYHQKVLEDPICDPIWACSFFFRDAPFSNCPKSHHNQLVSSLLPRSFLLFPLLGIKTLQYVMKFSQSGPIPPKLDISPTWVFFSGFFCQDKFLAHKFPLFIYRSSYTPTHIA